MSNAKTVIVTGGTRGIGLAIAKRFSLEGYNVVAVYKNDDQNAQSVQSRFQQERTLVLKADVSTPEGVKTVVDETIRRFGDISVLVNNAGISIISLFSDTALNDWNKVIQNNLTSAYLTSQAVLPYMMKNLYGRIVNIGSIWGAVGGSMEVAYSASKAGLHGMTKALAKEVGRMGITVNAVAPGFIDTDMNRDLDEFSRLEWAESTAVNRLGTPDDVAAAVYFLASEEASYCTAQILEVNGGI